MHAYRIVGRLAVSFGLICPLALTQETPAPESREQLVRKFVEAFNVKDTSAMALLVTDDVQWLSVDGESIAAETESKNELMSSMNAYFKSCPSCTSTLSGIIATKDRVSAIEIAHWETSKGKREQRSISVYEFSGDRIRRVYYFPAER